MEGNQVHQQGDRGQNHAPRDTTYMEFSKLVPMFFVKAEEPLEADEWIHMMQQKFELI